jgi:CelD/BcsL family acetyltransferase involved in cellulose biosynthesis
VSTSISAAVLSYAEDAWPGAGRRAADDGHLWSSAGTAYRVTVEGRPLRVILIEDAAGLAALGSAWGRVGGASATQSAFLTWEWLTAWSQRYVHGSRRLMILTVADGDEVIGIAPWYVDVVATGPVQVREIGFLGLPDAASDYLDVLTRRARERAVADALAQVLFGPLSSRWDTLSLRDMPAESPFLSRFLALLRRAGKDYSVEEGSFCPCVRLPATFDAYLAHLSSHGRQAYRRKMRVLNSKGSVSHRVLTSDEEVSRGLVEFRSVYEKRWGRTRAAEDLFAMIDAYRRQPTRRWQVEISLLEVDARPIAGLLHLTRGRQMYQYLMAVDRSFHKGISIGTLICGLNIERAIASGFTEYDFLKSEEEYKFQLMTHGRRAMNLRVHNRTLRSVAAWSLRCAQRFAKILLR